eukprot:3465576-Prymnesium_polylepis.1
MCLEQVRNESHLLLLIVHSLESPVPDQRARCLRARGIQQPPAQLVVGHALRERVRVDVVLVVQLAARPRRHHDPVHARVRVESTGTRAGTASVQRGQTAGNLVGLRDAPHRPHAQP